MVKINKSLRNETNHRQVNENISIFFSKNDR